MISREFSRALNVIFIGFFFASTLSFGDGQISSPAANSLYSKLMGKPLSPNAEQREAFLTMYQSGNIRGAAQLLSVSPAFIDGLVRDFSTRYLSAARKTSIPLDDSLALMMGVVRDQRDFREILTADYVYLPNPRHAFPLHNVKNNTTFTNLEKKVSTISDQLVFYAPQWQSNASVNEGAIGQIMEPSGILTSQSFAQSEYTAGTNRRPVVSALERFLCVPVDEWKTPYLDTHFIRRDVPRTPGGDPRVFQQECRSCHAVMDGLSLAFGRLDFKGEDGFIQNENLVAKYFQHPDTFPDGFIPKEDVWENLLSVRTDIPFGWRSPLKGQGIRAFGEMLSQSEAFSRCTVKRGFETLCGLSLPLKAPLITEFSARFESEEKFHVKELLLDLATDSRCHP